MSFQIRWGLLDPFTRSRLHATPKSKLLLSSLMLSRLLSLLPCPPGLPLPVRRRCEGVWRTLSAGLSETWLSPLDVGCHPQVTEPGALPIRMLSPGAGLNSHASRPASPLPGARRPLQLLGDHGAGWPHRPGTRAPRVPRRPRGLTAPAANGAAEPAGERRAAGWAGRAGRASGGRRYSPGSTAPITAFGDGPGAGCQLRFLLVTKREQPHRASHASGPAASGTRPCGKWLGPGERFRRPGSEPARTARRG